MLSMNSLWYAAYDIGLIDCLSYVNGSLVDSINPTLTPIDAMDMENGSNSFVVVCDGLGMCVMPSSMVDCQETLIDNSYEISMVEASFADNIFVAVVGST